MAKCHFIDGAGRRSATKVSQKSYSALRWWSTLLNFIWLFSGFPCEIFVFCGAAHREHHFVRYCLRWFNNHFVLWRRVIILRLSRQPIALRISPILSVPHFILLHAGCFTAQQRRWLRATGKSCSPSFQESQTDSSAKYKGEKIPTVTMGLHHPKCSILSFTVGKCRSWALFSIICIVGNGNVVSTLNTGNVCSQ